VLHLFEDDENDEVTVLLCTTFLSFKYQKKLKKSFLSLQIRDKMKYLLHISNKSFTFAA